MIFWLHGSFISSCTDEGFMTGLVLIVTCGMKPFAGIMMVSTCCLMTSCVMILTCILLTRRMMTRLAMTIIAVTRFVALYSRTRKKHVLLKS